MQANSVLNIAFFILLFGIVNTSYAAKCDINVMQKIRNDKIMTTLQKEIYLDELCLGETIKASGEIIDVQHKEGFEINATDRITYHVVSLAPNHNCGKAADMKKGQMISFSGIVNKVFWGSHKNVAQVSCVAR